MKNDYAKMWKAFSEQFPIDVVFDRAGAKIPQNRLRIYEYHQLKRIADLLEKLVDKKK